MARQTLFGSNRATLALCGAGMISHAHAAAARHLGLDIVAVASRSDARRLRRSAELAARAVTYDKLPAGADIVIVATPPACHVEHALHCLERGSSVIVEKPLATTLIDADRINLVSERHGHRVLYAENLAYAPAFRRWISEVSTMGQLGHLSIRMEQSAPSWGDFLDPDWGGGVLFDLGVHPIALAVLTGRACGAGEIVSASAHLHGETTDDRAEVTLTFERGLRVALELSWRDSSTTSWILQAASPSDALTLELMPDVLLERNGTPVPLPLIGSEPPMIATLGYIDQLRAFMADLETQTRPWMSVDFGRWILEIVCACYVSAGKGGMATPVPSGCDRSSTPWQLWRGQEPVT